MNRNLFDHYDPVSVPGPSKINILDVLTGTGAKFGYVYDSLYIQFVAARNNLARGLITMSIGQLPNGDWLSYDGHKITDERGTILTAKEYIDGVFRISRAAVYDINDNSHTHPTYNEILQHVIVYCNDPKYSRDIHETLGTVSPDCIYTVWKTAKQINYGEDNFILPGTIIGVLYRFPSNRIAFYTLYPKISNKEELRNIDRCAAKIIHAVLNEDKQPTGDQLAIDLLDIL